MKKTTMIATALALMMSSGGANACDDDNAIATLELQLGSILASETTCNLKYNEDAVQEFITKQVEGPMHKCMDEKYATFALDIDVMTQSAKRDIEAMPKSLLPAHCIQIRRVAKQYGFTK